MTTNNMLPWPKEKPEHLGLANSAYWEQYERQRAEAALSRLRIAVEALNNILPFVQHRSDCHFGSSNPNCECGALPEFLSAKETIAEIGEIPQS